MMDDFDPTRYGAPFAQAIGAEPAMPLDAGRPDRAMRPVLDALTAEAERSVVDRDAFSCCLAGVWLLHGYLDEAHRLCQDVPTADGSYWHGVMHRREGDYGNAQYWFRRAGEHPAGSLVASAAAAHPETVDLALGGHWNPVGFVDHVQRAAQRGGSLADACVAVQRAEWRALFDECWRKAVA
ncbi:hypothetical protein Pla108_16350 [Botrimarina colliarenosi]|uniref:Tetratricopeptide repeat protein n=1 Tax=Botrimarina colliarenosi TaxID=2528001 RepID=A0A5C6AKY7_9BACT|nr:hypothetical protein [Botrimarina colliarenosi]TWU00683.1 hypothetical protein Pla108_16350 [Botrimarina colliarenosi]